MRQIRLDQLFDILESCYNRRVDMFDSESPIEGPILVFDDIDIVGGTEASVL